MRPQITWRFWILALPIFTAMVVFVFLLWQLNERVLPIEVVASQTREIANASEARVRRQYPVDTAAIKSQLRWISSGRWTNDALVWGDPINSDLRVKLESARKMSEGPDALRLHWRFIAIARDLELNADIQRSYQERLFLVVFAIFVALVLSVVGLLAVRAVEHQRNHIRGRTDWQNQDDSIVPLPTFLSALESTPILFSSDFALVDPPDTALFQFLSRGASVRTILQLWTPYLDETDRDALTVYLTELVSHGKPPKHRNPLHHLQIDVDQLEPNAPKFVSAYGRALAKPNEQAEYFVLMVSDQTDYVQVSQLAEFQIKQHAEQTSILVALINLDLTELHELATRTEWVVAEVDSMVPVPMLVADRREAFLGRLRELILKAEYITKHYGLTLFKEKWAALYDDVDDENVSGRDGQERLIAIADRVSILVPEIKLIKSMASILLQARQQSAHERDRVYDVDPNFVESVSQKLDDAYTSFSESLSMGGSNAQAIKELQSKVGSTRSEIVEQFKRRSAEWTQLAGKEAELRVKGFDEISADHPLMSAISEICLACIHNSIDHGIETLPVRLGRHKPRVGRIDIELSRERELLVLLIRDDGNGLDFKAIQRQAIKDGVIKKGDPVSQSVLLKTIFRAGFSTTSSDRRKTFRADQQIGLDDVMALVKLHKGKISARSVAKEFCQFKVQFPAK